MKIRTQLRGALAALLAPSLLACAGGQKQTRDAPSPAELGTLEVAHQRQGAPLPALSEAARPQAPLYVSYRVCVDGPQGRTLDVKPLEATPAADEILLPVLRTSTWQVSGIDGAACFLENLVSSPDGTWRVTPQPQVLAVSERLPQASDATPELPPAVQQQLVGRSVVGLYRMCQASGSGIVITVTPVVSIPGADDNIAAVLRTWRYKPSASPLCWVEPLLFKLDAAPEKTGTPLGNLPRSANTNVINNILK